MRCLQCSLQESVCELGGWRPYELRFGRVAVRQQYTSYFFNYFVHAGLNTRPTKTSNSLVDKV